LIQPAINLNNPTSYKKVNYFELLWYILMFAKSRANIKGE
jgi:hypothetical protein